MVRPITPEPKITTDMKKPESHVGIDIGYCRAVSVAVQFE
jgi:hypothetical protein